MAPECSESAPPVIAARSALLEEWIVLLVDAFFLSAGSVISPGNCLPDLRTRASGNRAHHGLLSGISDITSVSGTNATDRLRKNLSAKSNSESSCSVSLAPSNPPRLRICHGVPVLVFTVWEVWAVP